MLDHCPGGARQARFICQVGRVIKKHILRQISAYYIVVGIAYPVLKSFFVQIHLRGELKTVKNLNKFQIKSQKQKYH